MSEAHWLCLNPKCGITFAWNRGIQVASYNLGDEPQDKLVPGETRPEGCPECGEEDVDSLEG